MPSVRSLEAEQECLESAFIQLTLLAGPELADFSRLTPRDVRSFTRGIRAFWRNYAKTVRDATNMGRAPGLKIELHKLRTFERVFQSRKEGIVGPIRPLGGRACLAVWHTHTGRDRTAVGARMLWLQNWQEEGDLMIVSETGQFETSLAPLPDYPQRYNLPEAQTSLEHLRAHLHPQNQWIVNWEHALSHEDAVFIVKTEQLMHLRAQWNSHIVDIMDFVNANGLSEPPKVAQFTTEATQKQCKEKSRERCDICDFQLGGWKEEECEEKRADTLEKTASMQMECLPKGSGERTSNDNLSACPTSEPEHSSEATELPVLTRCGHILGTSCLQSWVNSGHATCPTCRTALYTPELCLPAMIRPHYRACVDMLDAVEKMDASIDRHLLAGPKVVHGDRFPSLSLRMESTSLIGIGTLEKMMETVQIQASLLDVQPQPQPPAAAQANDQPGEAASDPEGAAMDIAIASVENVFMGVPSAEELGVVFVPSDPNQQNADEDEPMSSVENLENDVAAGLAEEEMLDEVL
ncbi:hypothetical protein K491DRAFT_688595 [Lophiostoma macrostomum CBS 122681]|uniref:RING-type domain-containing protein n=1 Tax=Lophiostoma macrostomum CBS 122681 TaxID=1314788 RepID=A0A6A6TLA9_9PLEO|nr:hypothetical protein K491DRAFT_688595 [Lophiostoma macrostomum CBS 122681]